MRILLLTEFYGEAPGGVEKHTGELKTALENAGHQVEVVTANRKKWDWLIGRNPLIRSIYFFIKAFVPASRCDAIYTIYTLSPYLSGLGLKALFGNRLIGGIWNTEALEKVCKSTFLKWLVDLSDDVIFFTDAHKKLYPRGHVIPNWVDLTLFKPASSLIRKKLGWGKDFVVVFVGRPSKGKGLHSLMEAVSQIGCKLLVVGSFVDDAYFKEYANKLKLGNKVHFVGKIPHGKLPDFYNAADVFCVPSTIFEGQGIVFIEAMACGRPILTTKVPAIMDTVGDAGIFVPLEDPKALANALRRLKASPQLRAKMGKNALFNSKGYSEPIVMRKYLDVLEGKK